MRRGVLGAAILGIAFASAGEAGAEASREAGRQLYVRYCGSCHGARGAGDGPVAAVLNVAPGNLQRLGERFGLPLPADRVLAYVDGRQDVPAHGERTMPVWGRAFYFALQEGRVPPEEGEVQEALQSLFLYLESIQPGGPNAPRTDPAPR